MKENYDRGVCEALMFAVRFLEGHEKGIAIDEFKMILDQARHGFTPDLRGG